jgi:DNA-binding MarR family transcriptional regulator
LRPLRFPCNSLNVETIGDEVARDIVFALDRVFDSLLSVIPMEGAGADIPLTLTEVRATRRLPLSGSVSMRALAGSLAVSLPATTHLVDRLVRKGVVVRSRPDHDRRLVLVELSERSKEWRRELFDRRARMVQQILEPVKGVTRGQFAAVLSQIADAASAHEAALRGTV